jgi:ribosome-associated protein
MAAGSDPLEIRPGLAIPGSELLYTYARAGGPGGQNVNKTATKARLKWRPGESTALREALSPEAFQRLMRKAAPLLGEDGAVQVVSERFRTREANRNACRRKLAELIRSWLAKPKKRIPTAPTRVSREKRLKEKKRKAQIKQKRRRPDPE